jgi:fused signal recognition particle receptor
LGLFKWKAGNETERPVDVEPDKAPGTRPSISSEADKGPGLIGRLRKGLSKTRDSFTGRLDRLFLGKKEITEDLLDDLEEILFTSDIGVAATQELIASVQEKVARKELRDTEKLKTALKDQMLAFLAVEGPKHSVPNPGEPLVIMVVGVNGVGKTTTIGKAAHRFRSEGKEVLLVAADTFRAAAVEQLTIWGDRVGAAVVKQGPGADPSAVAFDGLAAAVARKVDVVIVDTAGRLHTKINLMEELQKIHRVIGRKLPGAPHEVWLVLDATTGQNAISQAQIFNQSLGVTSIVLTKLDGTAKGGIVVGISRELGIPIRLIGIGEKIDDLREFDAVDFVKAIFD